MNESTVLTDLANSTDIAVSRWALALLTEDSYHVAHVDTDHVSDDDYPTIEA